MPQERLIYIVDDEDTISRLLEHWVTKKWGASGAHVCYRRSLPGSPLRTPGSGTPRYHASWHRRRRNP
jgi:hypothetical protein